MSVELNNAAGANSSYSLSDKLHHVYLGNPKTFGGEVGVRLGNLVNEYRSLLLEAYLGF